jgi:hypothetical protein
MDRNLAVNTDDDFVQINSKGLLWILICIKRII